MLEYHFLNLSYYINYIQMTSGTTGVTPRWKICVALTNAMTQYGMVMGRMYSEAYFPPQAKTDVSNVTC